MESGIYALYFEGCGVYIGKSKNIKNRFSQHLHLLRSGKHTELLQGAYKDSGKLPTLIKIVTAHPSWLDCLETYYIHYYIWNLRYPGKRLPALNTIRPEHDNKNQRIFKKWPKYYDYRRPMWEYLQPLDTVDKCTASYSEFTNFISELKRLNNL